MNYFNNIFTFLVNTGIELFNKYSINMHDLSNANLLYHIVKWFGNIIKFATVIELIVVYRNLYLFWFATQDIVWCRISILLFDLYILNCKPIVPEYILRVINKVFLLFINMYTYKIFDSTILCLNIYYLIMSDKIITYITHQLQDSAFKDLLNRSKQFIKDSNLDLDKLNKQISDLFKNSYNLLEQARNMIANGFNLDEYIQSFIDTSTNIQEMTFNMYNEINAMNTRKNTHAILASLLCIVSLIHYFYIPIQIESWRLLLNISFTIAYIWKMYIIGYYGIETKLLNNICKVNLIAKNCKSVAKIGQAGVRLYLANGSSRTSATLDLIRAGLKALL